MSKFAFMEVILCSIYSQRDSPSECQGFLSSGM